MADAVLLVRDLDAGIFPEHCVLTGERTTGATHARAWTRRRAVPTRRVPLPVTKPALARLRMRSSIWGAIACFGLGAIAMSVRNADPALAVIGGLVVTGSLWARLRAQRAFWVALELRADQGHVIVRRAHPAFDAEARRLFLRSLP